MLWFDKCNCIYSLIEKFVISNQNIQGGIMGLKESVQKLTDNVSNLTATQIIIVQGIDTLQQQVLDLQKLIDETSNVDPLIVAAADKVEEAVTAMKTALDEKPV